VNAPARRHASPELTEGAVARQNVLRVWAVFRRRWWLPPLLGLLGVGAMFAYAYTRPPRFTASGTVQIGLYAGVSTDRREPLPFDGRVAATHHGLLTSHSVVEAAMRSLGRELREGSARRAQREEFLRGIEIRPVVNTYLVQVAAEGSDPKDVVDRVNALMDAFIPFTESFFADRNLVLTRNLRESEKRVLEQLAQAEEAQREYLRTIGTTQFEAKRADLITRRQRVSGRLTDLQLELIRLSAEREELERRIALTEHEGDLEELTGRLGGQPLLERRSLLRDIKTRLTLLRTTLNDEHPDLTDLEGKLRAEEQAFQDDLRQAARISLRGLEEGEALQRTQVGRLEEEAHEVDEELSDLERQETEYRALERRVKWYDDELEVTRSRLRLSGTQDLTDVGARIIDRAEVPTAPANRFRWVDYLAMFAMTAGGALLALVVWDHLDDRIARESQVPETDLDLLARIPHEPAAASELAAVPPSSPAGDAFCFLRAALPETETRPLSVILVVSPGAGEGKSFTSYNLALTFARAGERTLLVDADMRRMAVTRALGQMDAPGLGQLLEGPGVLTEQTVPTEQAGLDLLPAGKQTGGNPADSLEGVRLEQVLAVAKEHYQRIVIDAPPLAIVADAALVAPHVDGVLVVARLRWTRQRQLTEAIARLRRSGARMLGLSLNDITRLDGFRDYHYRFGAGEESGEAAGA
jgi:polysaccharide biosynthesis transport protein